MELIFLFDGMSRPPAVPSLAASFYWTLFASEFL